MLNCFHTCMCINGVQYDFYYLFVRLWRFNYKPSIFFIAAFTLKGNPVNSKYKRTFVLIELHSFLVKEIFDFVNHSPVFFTNLLITIFLVWAILQKWFSDYETWSELGTSYDTSSITTALVYCLFFFYYTCGLLHILPCINSLFWQISGFMSFMDQIFAVTFKLSSYRNKVSANKILEGFFGIQDSNIQKIQSE